MRQQQQTNTTQQTGAHGTYDLTRDGDTIRIACDGVWAGNWTLAEGTTADLGEDQDIIEAACIALMNTASEDHIDDL